MSTFQTILNNLLGPGLIDITIIVSALFFFFTTIHIQASKQAKRNAVYNEELRELREEIFNQFEKNFFL